MHFSGLLKISGIPNTFGTKNAESVKKLREAEEHLRTLSGINASVFKSCSIGELKKIQTNFGLQVTNKTFEKLYEFSSENAAKAEWGCEFTKTDLETYQIDLLSDASGNVFEPKDVGLTIHDGKPCERNFVNDEFGNSVAEYKVTPTSLLYTVVTVNAGDVYTVKEFADAQGYDYNEELDEAGYFMSNPDSIYDWCQIGGRYARKFLIKDSCREYIAEESDGVIPAPAGYRWVVACRYKDICFDKMLEYRVDGIKNEYAICKKAYEESHNADLGSDVAQYSPEGMKYWGDLLYAAGESEKECLERRGGDMNAVYENLAYAFFTGEADSYDDWITCDYLRPGEEIGKLLQERFFADAGPNDVIVSVDFHE